MSLRPSQVTRRERLWLWLGWPVYVPLFLALCLYGWWRDRHPHPARPLTFGFLGVQFEMDEVIAPPIADTRRLPSSVLKGLHG
jgi:hypothetical protein